MENAIGCADLARNHWETSKFKALLRVEKLVSNHETFCAMNFFVQDHF